MLAPSAMVWVLAFTALVIYATGYAVIRELRRIADLLAQVVVSALAALEKMERDTDEIRRSR